MLPLLFLTVKMRLKCVWLDQMISVSSDHNFLQLQKVLGFVTWLLTTLTDQIGDGPKRLSASLSLALPRRFKPLPGLSFSSCSPMKGVQIVYGYQGDVSYENV